MLKKIKEKFNKHWELIFEIIAIIVIVLFAISLSPKNVQNDIFYTVSVGKLISENGIDFKDHFSWHENLPYTYPHWLYDLMMFKIYDFGGWNAIYISTCIFASILGICIYKTNSKLSKNKFISFLVTLGSLYLLENYITARAQLVTFILFILLVYNIERVLEERKLKNIIALIIIQIIIANLHVAVWPFTFVLYLPYVGEYLICELVEFSLYHKARMNKLKKEQKQIEKDIAKEGEKEDLLNDRESVRKDIEELENRVQRIKEKREENLKNPYKVRMEKNVNARWLILVMVIALLTGLATPLKTTPFTYTYLTLKSGETKSINEHLPMTLVDNTKIICTLVIFLGIITFTKVKIKVSDLFMLGGLTYLMLASRRQSSMFSLVGTFALVRLISEMILIYTGKDGKEILKNKLTKITTIILSIIIIGVSINSIIKRKNNGYISQKSYPVQASEWILENLDVKNIKLYNEYNYGSYLIYKGIPVFIDSRADLYADDFNTPTNDPSDGDDIFSDFMDTSTISRYYGETFDKYDITHVITKKDSKMNLIIQNADSEKYEVLYSDKYFIVYKIKYK